MNNQHPPGFGELLRHLSELCDDSSDDFYQNLPYPYRARYTPLMRLLSNGPKTVSEITAQLAITQGAVSQSIKLMLADGLIERSSGADARQSVIKLSALGLEASNDLQSHWEAIFCSIEQLEREVKLPLRNAMQSAITALNQESFVERIEAQKTKEHGNKQRSSHFLRDGKRYATFRPGYPESLAQTLAGLTSDKTLAVDVGCGNGQFSQLLAKHFEQVIASDISEDQIANTRTTANIDYRCEGAEQISVEDNSADLIVAAQAAHWFDLPAFYAEARRIAKPSAVLALISYGVPYIDDAVNAVFQQGYWQDIHRFWPAERRHVENCYSELDFPFQEISVTGQRIQREMRFNEFCGYISTWSAWRAAEDQNALYMFEDFFERLQKLWPDDATKTVIWPIACKVTHLI
jgi:SAM-dependent methyltransferase/DNA-binding MarR family transcriptional regulator